MDKSSEGSSIFSDDGSVYSPDKNDTDSSTNSSEVQYY